MLCAMLCYVMLCYVHYLNIIESLIITMSTKTQPEQPQKMARLPPEVNKIIYVRNLPYKITSD